MANHNDLFEDVPYAGPDVSAKGDDHSDLFEDVPHPDSKHQNKTSAGRAALVGAGQGATFGFADELTAPVVAAGAMAHDAFSSPDNKSVPTLPGGESTWDKYSRLMQTYRDTAREEQKAAQDEHPYAYTGGALAGGLLAPGLGAGSALKAAGTAGKAVEAASVPMLGELGAAGAGLATKAAGGAGVGAGVGGLFGAGEATGDLEDRLPAAEEGAKTGAKIGAFIPVAGAGMSKTGEGITAGLDKISELPFLKKTLESFRRGKAGENLVTEGGRQEASNVVRQKSGELYDDIKKLKNDVGSGIGKAIDSETEAGTKLDITDDVNDVLAKLKEIKASGSKDAASHADGIEREIKKLLGIKAETEDGSFAGVPKEELPEGLVLPKEDISAAPKFEVTPKQVQDLRQTLNPYTPQKEMNPQQVKPAQLAEDFSGSIKDKLTDAVPELADKEVPKMSPEGMPTDEMVTEPGLNSQYGSIKDSLKRLTINEKKLPEQIKEKINNVVAKLGNEDMSGDNARALVEDVLKNIEEVSPEIASKYRDTLSDISGRLKLSGEINKGLNSFGLGTFQSLGKAGANVAGLAVNKLKGSGQVESAAQTVGAPLLKSAESEALNTGVNAPQAQPGVVDKVKSFANTVLNTPASRISGAIENTDALANLKNAQPAQYQRQVATAAENAEPDTLKEQAQQVRTKYGNRGEQLAVVLEKMALQGKDSRRALMFTVMQNPAYKKMLGITGEAQ